MIKYFLIEESPYKNGKYTINLNFNAFPDIKIEESGSFNILSARLMGLTYANYLRICRDLFDAEIIGKGNKYPVAYFIYGEKLSSLVKVLNKKMELIMTIKNSKLPEEYKEKWREEYMDEFGKEPTYDLLGGDD